MKAQIRTIGDERWLVLSGSRGDSVGRLRIKAKERIELAMLLLGLEGEQVKVTIKPAAEVRHG